MQLGYAVTANEKQQIDAINLLYWPMNEKKKAPWAKSSINDCSGERIDSFPVPCSPCQVHPSAIIFSTLLGD